MGVVGWLKWVWSNVHCVNTVATPRVPKQTREWGELGLSFLGGKYPITEVCEGRMGRSWDLAKVSNRSDLSGSDCGAAALRAMLCMEKLMAVENFGSL